MIYLDNAATTYPKPTPVLEGLEFAYRSYSFNAGRGFYKQSFECLNVLENLRKEIASFCNSDPNKVAILSSATEALNLIINGFKYENGMNIYVTPFEHNAIIRPLYNIKKRFNINIHVLPFDKATWKPEMEKIENLFALNNPSIVISSQISNVTGLLVDYEKIFAASKKYGSTNILDAAQGYGIVGINKKDLDYIVFAGHKSFYGPFGIGGFISLTSNELEIVKSGGTGSDTLNHSMPEHNHERYEAGSPNVPSAYGVLCGIKWLKQNLESKKSTEKDLTNYLIQELNGIEKIKVFIPKDTSSIFGIVSFAVEGYKADEVGAILSDEFDICVRTGFHCAPFVHDFIGSITNGGTVRASLSFNSKKSDIDLLIEALKTL